MSCLRQEGMKNLKLIKGRKWLNIFFFFLFIFWAGWEGKICTVGTIMHINIKVQCKEDVASDQPAIMGPQSFLFEETVPTTEIP